MIIVVQFLLLALGFVLLVKGADWFVDGAVGIAARFGIPQLIIGLTIVAMGTSAPEAAVSLTAALRGSADITIGNIVGSNILNVLIILGLSAVVTPLLVEKSTVRYEIPFMIAISGLLLALGWDGEVTLSDAIVLWVAFLLYLAYLFYMAHHSDSQEEENGEVKVWWKSVLLLLLGLAMIIFGSDFAVDAATELARAFGMSERLIGLTIVALGTSLPELFTSVSAARKGNADIAIGNIVGSNVFNILFVVGTTGLVTAVPFAPAFRIDMWFAIGAAALLLLCTVWKKRLNRWCGALMVLSYGGYFAYLLMK